MRTRDSAQTGKVRVEIEILGIAHRGEHGAQIGRHGLQHHHPDQGPVLVGHTQHHHREGDEGQKCHVVGDEHGGNKAQQDQQNAEQPEVAHPEAEPVGQPGEEPGLAQPRHNGHEAIEQGQGTQVQIVPVGPVRRHEKAAHQGREGGDEQHRLPPDKAADGRHGKNSSI